MITPRMVMPFFWLTLLELTLRGIENVLQHAERYHFSAIFTVTFIVLFWGHAFKQRKQP